MENDLERWIIAKRRPVRGVTLLPGRLGLPAWLAAAHAFDSDRVRIVPSSAIAELALDGEGDYALVNCPCGEHPVVRDLLEKCSGCERYYLLERGRVFVAYGAMTPPEHRATG